MIAEKPETYAEMIKADHQATLNDLLSRWHSWAQGYKAIRGFKSRSLVCGDYLISRQHDDMNGALDCDLENTTMSSVDFQVSEMQEPHRTAMYMQAKNLSTGLTVWNSPRLPEDQIERAGVVSKARDILIGRLVNCGVM